MCIRDRRKAQREAAKDHTSAYNQMENNLASYTSELNQTKSSIHSLQAQLATKPGEVFTREQNKIAADYRATVEKINAEATKYANKKGITKTQAEELKQSKLQEASLQKNLDLRLAQMCIRDRRRGPERAAPILRETATASATSSSP